MCVSLRIQTDKLLRNYTHETEGTYAIISLLIKVQNSTPCAHVGRRRGCSGDVHTAYNIDNLYMGVHAHSTYYYYKYKWLVITYR